MTRPVLLGLICATALAACTPPGGQAPTMSASPLTPPVIGGRDNLRLGPPPPASPDEIAVPIYDPKQAVGGVTQIRGEALKEAAQSYGSQAGYARRSRDISERLQIRSMDLSQVFDFSRVATMDPIHAGVVIPPVVSRSFDAYMTDGREASAADEYLTIVRPGRLAPIAPTWRDYLIFAQNTPEEPARSLMPANADEKRLFEGWLREGWEAGVQLADAEFEERIARLKRDYMGMLQYRRLVAIGLMDRLVLADANFGTTVSGNEMRIGSRTVRIITDAQFRNQPSRWNVAEVRAKGGLVDLPPVTSFK